MSMEYVLTTKFVPNCVCWFSSTIATSALSANSTALEPRVITNPCSSALA
jgi:hypothetical protein